MESNADSNFYGNKTKQIVMKAENANSSILVAMRYLSETETKLNTKGNKQRERQKDVFLFLFKISEVDLISQYENITTMLLDSILTKEILDACMVDVLLYLIVSTEMTNNQYPFDFRRINDKIRINVLL